MLEFQYDPSQFTVTLELFNKDELMGTSKIKILVVSKYFKGKLQLKGLKPAKLFNDIC